MFNGGSTGQVNTTQSQGSQRLRPTRNRNLRLSRRPTVIANGGNTNTCIDRLSSNATIYCDNRSEIRKRESL